MILLAILKQSVIPQTHEDLLHWCSHIGMSFIIQTAGMDLLNHFLHTHHYDYLAFIPTLIVGLGYKLIVESAALQETMVSMARNSMGMGAAMVLMRLLE